MTKDIQLHGQQLKLYRVSGYANAWCSDQQITQRVERKRKELFRELRYTEKQTKALEEGYF